MKRRLLLPYSLTILTMAGCSMAPDQTSSEDTASTSHNPANERLQPAKPSKSKPTPSPTDLLTESLYQQHQEWKGIPYRLGGMSRRGIDCSALVYLIYRDHMGIELPRTTRYQAVARGHQSGPVAPGRPGILQDGPQGTTRGDLHREWQVFARLRVQRRHHLAHAGLLLEKSLLAGAQAGTRIR